MRSNDLIRPSKRCQHGLTVHFLPVTLVNCELLTCFRLPPQVLNRFQHQMTYLSVVIHSASKFPSERFCGRTAANGVLKANPCAEMQNHQLQTKRNTHFAVCSPKAKCVPCGEIWGTFNHDECLICVPCPLCFMAMTSKNPPLYIGAGEHLCKSL